MSQLFGNKSPKTPHLVRFGKRGVAGDVADLRRDIDEAFDTVEAILTPEGGFAVPLTNETGAASVKGSVVKADGATDNAFALSDSNCDCPIGVVYQDGIADGEQCYIVIGGRAQVLLKDSTASTRGYWVKTANAAGRADATTSGPPGADPSHWQEIGHCLETKGGGTDVLAYCILHFN